jgi:hypothetical protein
VAHNVSTGWSAGIGLAVISVVLAAVVYLGIVRDNSEAFAEEIAQAAHAEKQRIVDVLERGGTFEIELATYSQRQDFADGVMPEFMRFPDRTVERISMTVDAAGIIQESAATISDERGVVLATAIDTGTTRVLTAPGGETFEFRSATAIGQSLIAWLDRVFEHAHVLQAEGQYSKTGTSTLADMASIVFEREYSGVSDGPHIRSEYEVAESNPLTFRVATFERRNGEEILVHETVVLGYIITPTDSE